MLPPRIVRRVVLAPLLIVLTPVLLLTLPAWLVLGTAASLGTPPPRRRGTRFVWFGAACLTLECALLIACLGLWVASGFGGRLNRDQYQDRHYALITWFLGKVYGAAESVFHLAVDIHEPLLTPADRAALRARPVIVLSRHAGPGDSFLLVHHLLARYGRRPRIVMKTKLQFDPSVDVVVNRLPNALVPAKGGRRRVIGEIRRLASTMDSGDALVLFLEGGNFTPRRRRLAIRQLEEKGLAEEAARARRLEHVLPPRPGGAIAAIDACPAADVVFVAHTGLDDLVTLGDMWHRLPAAARITARWWRVPAPEVPREREARIRWLFAQRERIDTWIAANHTTPRSTQTAIFHDKDPK
ncbi:1-acyl-sn-glycerol-3-phosphate acyltransferase [Nonomuraea sp. NPDC005983]|uniref:1-acyl-sn-glycerol-3-phosphate acyltransferase n=1 Tax=Nonomuraea sp. NPDC005983 TaxID=3155595 RepID=UPI0033BD551D